LEEKTEENYIFIPGTELHFYVGPDTVLDARQNVEDILLKRLIYSK